MTGSERNITSLPLNYTYGISLFCASLLKGSATIVTRKGIMDEEFWDLFENEHITAFHGVPNTYDMLLQLGIFEEDFPDLKVLSQAGGKLSEDLHRSIAQYAGEHNKQFVVMYGQCEATSCISLLPPQKALEKPGSVGVAFPGGEIELHDENGNLKSEIVCLLDDQGRIENNYKMEYTYDDNGRNTSIESFVWSEDQWILDSVERYDYAEVATCISNVNSLVSNSSAKKVLANGQLNIIADEKQPTQALPKGGMRYTLFR